MTVLGYFRVSSVRQLLMHQKYEISQYALKNNIIIDRFIEESSHSKNINFFKDSFFQLFRK